MKNNINLMHYQKENMLSYKITLYIFHFSCRVTFLLFFYELFYFAFSNENDLKKIIFIFYFTVIVVIITQYS